MRATTQPTFRSAGRTSPSDLDNPFGASPHLGHIVGVVRVLRWFVSLLAAVMALAIVPRTVIARDAEAVFRNNLSVLSDRADNVAHSLTSGVSMKDFSTGSDRFDGEWVLGTHQMASLGLTQLLLANPKRADLHVRWLPAIRRSSEVLLEEDTRRFATNAWNSDALQSLDDPVGRDAWIGYVALALGLHRLVDPEFPHGPIHDRIIATLKSRIEQSPTSIIATYPGETYPVDNAACIAAIAIWGTATGTDQSAFVEEWTAEFERSYVEPTSGFVRQATDTPDYGTPRGSGTALSAYFLGFVDRALSEKLFRALIKNGKQEVFGMATIREYPDGFAGTGDIDSGPVILGASVSATGFAIGSAKRFGDLGSFRQLHRTAELFGMPYRSAHGKGFVVGGPLGDAILLAMDTAGDAPSRVRSLP